jgi:hypothetical protein
MGMFIEQAFCQGPHAVASVYRQAAGPALVPDQEKGRSGNILPADYHVKKCLNKITKVPDTIVR